MELGLFNPSLSLGLLPYREGEGVLRLPVQHSAIKSQTASKIDIVGRHPHALVMTPNPECVTVETTILDALHIMHDGKFMHRPVLDKDGSVAACVDVLQITHAAISMVESNPGGVSDVTNTMMQKFWDSALALEPPDDYDLQRYDRTID